MTPIAPSSGPVRTLRSDIVFAFVLALGCYVAWLLREVLVLLYVSALFAVVLSPVVRATAQGRLVMSPRHYPLRRPFLRGKAQ